MMIENDLQYPIGKYSPAAYSDELKNQWLHDISFLPKDVEIAIQNLDAHHLSQPYRPGGWTINQLVHHIADSHMNAYIRFKLGLTEDNPAIKPYEEKDWALLNDVNSVPVNVSVTLLFALHQRWYTALKDLGNDDWERTVFHPEHQKKMSLWFLLGMYAWHGRHHVAHINSYKERMGLR